MAYLQARSGIARSGVTYCGWTPPSIALKINGTDRSTNMLNTWTVTQSADSVSSMLTFSMKSFTPTLGQTVTLAYAKPNDYLFSGILVDMEAETHNRAGSVVWHCLAMGTLWMMDSYEVVTKRWDNRSVGHIVADILANFTNPSHGFHIGYIPSDLGYVDVRATLERPSVLIDRIAKQVNAYWEVTPNKVVNLFTEYPEDTISITPTNVFNVKYGEDYSQVRSRTYVKGRPVRVTVRAEPLAATLEVDDLSPFGFAAHTDGGLVVCDSQLLTYAATSDTDGPGYLIMDTVSNPIRFPIPGDSEVFCLPFEGSSGIGVHVIEDERYGQDAGFVLAASENLLFAGSDKRLTFTSVNRYLRPGRTVTASGITSPITITGDYRIQQIRIFPYGAVSSTQAQLWREVTTSNFRRTLNTFLAQVDS